MVCRGIGDWDCDWDCEEVGGAKQSLGTLGGLGGLGLWIGDCGLWTVDCVCGVWIVWSVCGVWIVDCGLGIVNWGHWGDWDCEEVGGATQSPGALGTIKSHHQGIACEEISSGSGAAPWPPTTSNRLTRACSPTPLFPQEGTMLPTALNTRLQKHQQSHTGG